MSRQEPAWLKRTRPCPFFSQGRCLFADSCNFLHDVKVRSVVDQSVRNTVLAKQSPVIKPVFNPPSVVVNSASPRSVILSSPESSASPTQDPSRYSDLLSVLSDVIGPSPDASVSNEVTSESPTSSRRASFLPTTAAVDRSHSINSPSSSSLSLARFKFPTTVADSKTESNVSTSPGVALQPADETVSDVAFLPQGEVFQEDDEPVAEFMPVPDDEAVPGEVTTSPYLAEDSGLYVIGSDVEEEANSAADENVIDRSEEDSAVIASNRNSILSSFTGASLLASPQGNIFGEPVVASTIDDDSSDLLSPVTMSAKLRPFPFPPFDPRVKRGDSIDSGYADSWTSPLLFPRTPPRSFRSSVGFFPSHSRRASLVSPTTVQDRRVSYDVRAIRPSPQYTIEAIDEDEDDESSEDSGENEDVAFTILGAYDSPQSEEQVEEEAHDTRQVDAAAVPEQSVVAESDKLSVPPSLFHRPRHSSTTSDLDAYNQSLFLSEGKESFVTALSTQPSFDSLSDASTRVSPVKQDSLLSCISRTSTPDTSLLSHDDHSHEILDRHIVDSPIEKPSTSHSIEVTGLAAQSPTQEVSEEGTSVVSSPIREISADSTPVRTDLPQGVPPQGAISVKKRWSQVEVLHMPPVAGVPGRGVLGARTEDAMTLCIDTSIASVPVEHTLEPSPLPVAFRRDASPLVDTRVCPDRHSVGSTESPRRSAPAGAAVRDSVSPSVEDIRVLHPDRHSVELGGSMEPPLQPSPASRAIDHSHSSFVEDSRVLHFDRHSVESRAARSSLADDAHRFVVPSATGDAESRSPESSYSTELSDVVSLNGDNIGAVFLVADGEDSGLGQLSPSAAYADLLDMPSFQADRIIAEDDSSVSEDFTESFSLGSSNFSQSRRLTFPLPPPFLPAGFVENSTLPNEAETSFCSAVESVDAEEHTGDALLPETPLEESQQLHSGPDSTERARTSQVEAGYYTRTDPPLRWRRSADEQPETHAEEMQRLRSVSDLTEKPGPSQVQAHRSPDSNTDFFSQRSRAASDITVKAKSSPMIPLEDAAATSEASQVPVEDPPRADSVQSLYDQYFDDDTTDSADEDIAHEVRSAGEEFQRPDFSESVATCSEPWPAQSSHVSPLETTPSSDVTRTNLVTDSAPSEPVLRPLLTGRRSPSDSSLGELISKVNPTDTREPSSMPTPPCNRLQVREPGSTMVPLGFRRFKQMPVVQPPLRSASQPLHSALPVADLLRIRTDIADGDVPPACSSAGYASSSRSSPLPTPSLSAPPTSGMKPLRLPTIINHNERSSVSSHSSSIASSILSLDRISHSSASHSPTVSSVTSLSRNSLLSSSCPPIPEHIQHTPTLSDRNSPVPQVVDHTGSAYSTLTRRDSRSVSAPLQQPKHWRLSHYRAGSRNYTSTDITRHLSKRASTLSLSYVPEHEAEGDGEPSVAGPIQSAPPADWMRPASALAVPVHAIATPKPTLLFAIASDDVEQVRQVLESGEAGPNDDVGPQSALAFTLTNDKLLHKQEIVKALLAYGANPTALRNKVMNPSSRSEVGDEPRNLSPETTLEGMDPATRYFVARADAAHTRQTSQLIYRSFFRPLTRVRYDVIGQDWALEQLFRVLSMHSQKLAVAPIVVLLCGPSGHGKSLLARKFGSLLDVPVHTVNMTTLRSTHDIWQSYSMSPYEEPSSCTLAEFLMENEGKRCVVVLDEIEKVEDQKALWSLLMPWELGRCSLEAGKRHADARNVIWLGTSNVGHELVFEHHQNRAEPEKQMTRQEYLELTEILRPRVSHHLGPSLVSRVTTVLPFVPFTLDERKAIAAEAVYTLAGEAARELSPQDVESLVTKALPSYHPSEGARSLHRAISNLLIDCI